MSEPDWRPWSAEYFGEAQSPNGVLNIGGVEVPMWCGSASVYVREFEDDWGDES